MIERSNIPARLRKAELEHLDLLLRPLHEQNLLASRQKQMQQRPADTSTPLVGLSNGVAASYDATRAPGTDLSYDTEVNGGLHSYGGREVPIVEESEWNLADFEMDPTMGLSPSHMLDMASALGNEGASFDQEQWLWDIPGMVDLGVGKEEGGGG